MGKPEITVEDFTSLCAEVNMTSSASGWFKRNGLAEDIEGAIVHSARRGMSDLMMALILDQDDRSPGESFGNICATMMVAGFALGWETHKQFGGGHDSDRGDDPEE